METCCDQTIRIKKIMEILKPWEQGFSVANLPREPRPTSKAVRPDDKRRIGGLTKFANGSAAQLQDDATRKKQRAKAVATTKQRRSKFLIASAAEKLQEREYDPMDLLIDVAQGKALYDDHPFLPILLERIIEIKNRIEYEDGYGVLMLLDQLKVESHGYLMDSYTPKEHRIKVATELLQYTRPKLKQTEHITKGEGDLSGVATPLTEAEVISFKKWFANEF